jgi:hypothetical protein
MRAMRPPRSRYETKHAADDSVKHRNSASDNNQDWTDTIAGDTPMKSAPIAASHRLRVLRQTSHPARAEFSPKRTAWTTLAVGSISPPIPLAAARRREYRGGKCVIGRKLPSAAGRTKPWPFSRPRVPLT